MESHLADALVRRRGRLLLLSELLDLLDLFRRERAVEVLRAHLGVEHLRDGTTTRLWLLRYAKPQVHRHTSEVLSLSDLSACAGGPLEEVGELQEGTFRFDRGRPGLLPLAKLLDVLDLAE